MYGSMDLLGAATAMKHAELVAGVQTAVARKMLDHQQSQGHAAVRLIQAAGETVQAAAAGKGHANVPPAAAPTGVGRCVDCYA